MALSSIKHTNVQTRKLTKNTFTTPEQHSVCTTRQNVARKRHGPT